jgi:hypothetical protein
MMNEAMAPTWIYFERTHRHARIAQKQERKTYDGVGPPLAHEKNTLRGWSRHVLGKEHW